MCQLLKHTQKNHLLINVSPITFIDHFILIFVAGASLEKLSSTFVTMVGVTSSTERTSVEKAKCTKLSFSLLQ